MKKLIAYFEGSVKELRALIDEPVPGIEKMAEVLSGNAEKMNEARKLPVIHL